MNRPPIYWYKAKKILSRRDKVLKKIIQKYNKGHLTSKNDPFFSICRTIVGQQISTKAADAIWMKFSKICKNKIKPQIVYKIKLYNLKKCGFRQKISYLETFQKFFK